MDQKVRDLSELQQIMAEFKMIALAALVATAAIWVFVSMNLMWVAATYFGFLTLISLLYFFIDSSSDTPNDSSRGDL